MSTEEQVSSVDEQVQTNTFERGIIFVPDDRKEDRLKFDSGISPSVKGSILCEELTYHRHPSHSVPRKPYVRSILFSRYQKSNRPLSRSFYDWSMSHHTARRRRPERGEFKGEGQDEESTTVKDLLFIEMRRLYCWRIETAKGQLWSTTTLPPMIRAFGGSNLRPHSIQIETKNTETRQSLPSHVVWPFPARSESQMHWPLNNDRLMHCEAFEWHFRNRQGSTIDNESDANHAEVSLHTAACQNQQDDSSEEDDDQYNKERYSGSLNVNSRQWRESVASLLYFEHCWQIPEVAGSWNSRATIPERWAVCRELTSMVFVEWELLKVIIEEVCVHYVSFVQFRACWTEWNVPMQERKHTHTDKCYATTFKSRIYVERRENPEQMNKKRKEKLLMSFFFCFVICLGRRLYSPFASSVGEESIHR